MATLVIEHSHVQLHYNTQAEKQRMVASAMCYVYALVFGGNIFTHPLH